MRLARKPYFGAGSGYGERVGSGYRPCGALEPLAGLVCKLKYNPVVVRLDTTRPCKGCRQKQDGTENAQPPQNSFIAHAFPPLA
jgi:hypothetical protein